jgi:hypothetical protein
MIKRKNDKEAQVVRDFRSSLKQNRNCYRHQQNIGEQINWLFSNKMICPGQKWIKWQKYQERFIYQLIHSALWIIKLNYVKMTGNHLQYGFRNTMAILIARGLFLNKY